MAPGGRTPWSSIDLTAIANMIDSMGAEQAAADVAALAAAIKRAEAAAKKVRSVFLETAPSLSGEAASASLTKASQLSAQITKSASKAGSANSGLRGVAAALAATKTKAPAVRAIAAQAASSDWTPDEIAEVRATLATAMNAAYSDPMLGTSTPLNDAEPQLATANPPAVASVPTAHAPGKPADQDSASALGGLGAPGSSSKNGAAPGSASGGQDAPANTAGTAANQQAPTGTSSPGKPGGPADPSGPPPGTNTGNPANPSGVPLVPGAFGAGRPGPTGSGQLGGGARVAGGAGLTPKSALTPPRLGSPPTTGLPVSAAPARASMGPGMRGGMPFLPRGATRSDEEEDRKGAAYLHAREHADEVVGELPLVGPAVIGEPEPPPAADSQPGGNTPDRHR